MRTKVIRCSQAAFDNIERRVSMSDPLATRNQTCVLIDRLLFECPNCIHAFECLANLHTECIKDSDILASR